MKAKDIEVYECPECHVRYHVDGLCDLPPEECPDCEVELIYLGFFDEVWSKESR